MHEGVLPSMASAHSHDRFPEPKVLDYADSTVRALAAAIPLLGGPAIKLMDRVITPPLEYRRVNWLNHLADRLDRLEEAVAGFSVASLVDDDEFITAVTTASQIAVRNHSEEKLAALKNAVVNVALRTEPDVERQAVFLSLVDYLTPAHLRLMFFFRDIRTSLRYSAVTRPGATTRDIVLEQVPGIPPDAYDLLRQDLENRGLVDFPVLPTLGLTDERTTAFGEAFLRFISEHEGTPG